MGANLLRGLGQAGVLALLFLGSAELLLNRKLSLPVSRMWKKREQAGPPIWFTLDESRPSSPLQRAAIHIMQRCAAAFQFIASAITPEQPLGSGTSCQLAPPSSVPKTSPLRAVA